MGAWGHGHFEDDSALDFMADVEESNNPKELFQQAFDRAIESEYVESDDGNAVIVSATYIDSKLNGTKYSSPDDDEPLDVDTFRDRHPRVELSDLRAKAVQALQKTLGDNSELSELWQENEGDYPAWRAGIEKLITRLTR